MAVDPLVALISLAQAKTFLKITGSTEDPLLEALVNRASKLASSYCGRKFVSATHTEYHDGAGQDNLLLINYPVSSITSIHEDVTRAFDASTIISSDDYILEGEAGIVRLYNGRSQFLAGKANIRIIYVAGFVEGTSVPADLQHAVQLMVSYAYKRHYQDQKIGIRSESIGERNTTFEIEDIPKAAAKILDQYRVANTPSHAF